VKQFIGYYCAPEQNNEQPLYPATFGEYGMAAVRQKGSEARG
jgi:hypothetical protein